MNFNFKIAFFVTLGFLAITFVLFAFYLIFTMFAFMDSGVKMPMSNTNDCDGDYCANNPENKVQNNTKYDDKNIAKVSEDKVYQNIDFRLRFDKLDSDDIIECSSDINLSVYVFDKTQTDFMSVNERQEICDNRSSMQYIYVTSKEQGAEIIKKYKMDFKTSPYTISGFKGTRYVENLAQNYGSEKVDFVTIETNDYFYMITSDFYTKNVTLW
jgi:hypothetical protein